MKNLNNKTLKLCSLKPLTGFLRDGYCKPVNGDYGNHIICAKMNKKFLNFTAKHGNNLYSIVKPGDNWCICQGRYLEALQKGKAPKVIKNATYKYINPKIKRMMFKKEFKGGNYLPKLRELTKKNKKHIYKLYDPQNKRILAIEEGINQYKTKKNKRHAAQMKKARFNVLRLYRKNKDKKGCNNLTKDMKYMDKKYNLGNTKNICI
tara:strand:+ start:913 stop:1530 length:618 start_codon:yes stop_codon:yes gene_type:complete